MGIPQGSVLSPLLCNLYLSEAMDILSSNDSEYVDNNLVGLEMLTQGDGEIKPEERC